MRTFNRAVAVVKPKQPYIDWANGVGEDGEEPYPNKVFGQDCNAYTIDEADDDDALARVFGRYWQLIFEEELAAWTLDETEWPAKRSKAMFDKWFNVEIHSVVIDLGKTRLRIEE